MASFTPNGSCNVDPFWERLLAAKADGKGYFTCRGEVYRLDETATVIVSPGETITWDVYPPTKDPVR